MNDKVIFICYSLAVGGGERHLAAIANGLAELGVKVKIILLDNPIVVFDLHPSIEVVFLEQEPIKANLATNKKQVKIEHFQEKTDISLFDTMKLLFFHFFNKNAYKVFDLELYLRRKYANKIHDYLRQYPDWTVVSFMAYCYVSSMMALKDYDNKSYYVEFSAPDFEFSDGHPMNTLKRKYLPRVAGGIYQTEEEKDFYTYLSCRKYVIPNPIFGNYPQRHVGVRKKEIVTFCRLHKVKNLPLLIDACQELFQRYPDYILSIYGEGEEKNHLVDYVQEKRLAQKVIFHDFDVALHDKIKDCAMYVSTSDREGISNSMLEAMAIGLPTICTDCPAGGARMMITPYENGLLVPCRDKNALVKAMIEIIDNPDLAEKMSQNSIMIRERLKLEKIVKMWAEALEVVRK